MATPFALVRRTHVSIICFVSFGWLDSTSLMAGWLGRDSSSVSLGLEDRYISLEDRNYGHGFRDMIIGGLNGPLASNIRNVLSAKKIPTVRFFKVAQSTSA